MPKQRVAEETHYIRTPKGRRARVKACLPEHGGALADLYRDIFDRGLEVMERRVEAMRKRAAAKAEQ